MPLVGLTSPERVAASEIWAPTVTVAAETWVARVGVFFSTTEVSPSSPQALSAFSLFSSPE